MNQYKERLFILVVIICFSHQVRAQDTVCSCNSPRLDYHTPIGVMIDHGHVKGKWMISYRYMEMMMRGNLMGTDKVSNDRIYQSYLMAPDKMKIQMHMLMIMYGLSDKISLMGMVNYMSNAMDMSMMMYGMMTMGNTNMSDVEMHNHSRASGFGDIRLYGLYNLLNDKRHQILLSAGMSVPTGSISHKGNTMMGEGLKYTYSMQTGTGTFSVLPGITYTGNGSSYSWGIQLTSDIKTGKNVKGYKWGNEIAITGWLARNWNDWLSNSIRVGGNSIGRIKRFDSEIASFRNVDPDADVNNSGGQRVSAYVGINFLIPQGILRGNRIGMEYGIPLYQNVNGIQMRSKALINAGWQYSF